MVAGSQQAVSLFLPSPCSIIWCILFVRDRNRLVTSHILMHLFEGLHALSPQGTFAQLSQVTRLVEV